MTGLKGWTITGHARDMLAERGIAPSELVQTLLDPDKIDALVNDNPAHAERVTLYVRGKVLAWVDDPDKTVITVGIQGANSLNWEAHALARAGTPEQDCLPVEDLLVAVPAKRGRRPGSKNRQREVDRNGPVEVRHVLDGVLHPSLVETAKAMATERGVGFDKIRVLGPARFEIDLD